MTCKKDARNNTLVSQMLQSSQVVYFGWESPMLGLEHFTMPSETRQLKTVLKARQL